MRVPERATRPSPANRSRYSRRSRPISRQPLPCVERDRIARVVLRRAAIGGVADGRRPRRRSRLAAPRSCAGRLLRRLRRRLRPRFEAAATASAGRCFGLEQHLGADAAVGEDLEQHRVAHASVDDVHLADAAVAARRWRTRPWEPCRPRSSRRRSAAAPRRADSRDCSSPARVLDAGDVGQQDQLLGLECRARSSAAATSALTL